MTVLPREKRKKGTAGRGSATFPPPRAPRHTGTRVGPPPPALIPSASSPRDLHLPTCLHRIPLLSPRLPLLAYLPPPPLLALLAKPPPSPPPPTQKRRRLLSRGAAEASRPLSTAAPAVGWFRAAPVGFEPRAAARRSSVSRSCYTARAFRSRRIGFRSVPARGGLDFDGEWVVSSIGDFECLISSLLA